MPLSKRRRTSGPALTSRATQQSTISFRSSKAGVSHSTNKPKPLSNAAGSKASTEGDPESHEIATAELDAQNETPVIEAIAFDGTKAQISEGEENVELVDKEEQELDQVAIALPEAKIKSYWAGKERDRKAPRLHQQDLGVREKILREFDMSSRYGPGIGISRHARWHRAHNLGMDPPIEVLAVLLKETRSGGSRSVRRDTEKSIVEELIMSSRVRGDTVGEVR